MIERVEKPGAELFSPAERIGELLKRQLLSDRGFYFFSPDETTSNRFDAVYEVEQRAWGDLTVLDGDLPESNTGRIVEMLSENVLFSVMVGHLMNGEQAMMGSYEAFFSIITAQLLQHMKFVKQAASVGWRPDLPAINLLSTSTCWRQDHNGYTHQSPALISTLLGVPSNLANCIFPVDDVAAEEAFRYMMNSRNVVNLTTFNKVPLPRYIDSHHAKFLFDNGGASIYHFASDADPDYVLTAAGDIMTHEAISAIQVLHEDMPGLRLRFVGINALSYGAIGTSENKLSSEKFNDLFTSDKPIIANFHGYPAALEAILMRYTWRERLHVHGYHEEGSTTTPHEMLRRNGCSRYDLAAEVARLAGRTDLTEKYQGILQENHVFAIKNGKDLIK